MVFKKFIRVELQLILRSDRKGKCVTRLLQKMVYMSFEKFKRVEILVEFAFGIQMVVSQSNILE